MKRLTPTTTSLAHPHQRQIGRSIAKVYTSGPRPGAEMDCRLPRLPHPYCPPSQPMAERDIDIAKEYPKPWTEEVSTALRRGSGESGQSGSGGTCPPVASGPLAGGGVREGASYGDPH